MGPRSVLGVWEKSSASSISILLLHIVNIMVSKRGCFYHFLLPFYSIDFEFPSYINHCLPLYSKEGVMF